MQVRARKPSANSGNNNFITDIKVVTTSTLIVFNSSTTGKKHGGYYNEKLWLATGEVL